METLIKELETQLNHARADRNKSQKKYIAHRLKTDPAFLEKKRARDREYVRRRYWSDEAYRQNRLERERKKNISYDNIDDKDEDQKTANSADS